MKRVLTIIFFLALGTSLVGLVMKNSNQKLDLQELAATDINKTFDYGFNIEADNLPERKFISDTAHQSISFKTKHWGIYDIIGWFEKFEIVCYYDKEDFSDAVIEARLYPISINMPSNRMQEHIKQAEFFDVQTHPIVYYKSDSMYRVADSLYEISGKMIIKNISKPVMLRAKLNGYVVPEIKKTPGFTIDGFIKRSDFQLGGDELLPGNQLDMLGAKVYFTCNLRLEREGR